MNQTQHTRKKRELFLGGLVVLIIQFFALIPLAHAEGEFVEFFEELLYGSGAWVGFLLIVGLIFVISVASKWSSIVLIPFAVFMALFYFDNVSVNNNFMWSGVLMIVTSILLILKLVYEGKKR